MANPRVKSSGAASRIVPVTVGASAQASASGSDALSAGKAATIRTSSDETRSNLQCSAPFQSHSTLPRVAAN